MTILYLLIMSTFIQIPNRINQLPKRSKLEEIFTYAAIRSQIKNESYKAIMLKDELAELIGVDVRTIYNHVDILEKSGLILDITKQHGTGEYSHNVYQFDYLKDEYFIMNPDLIHEESISAKLKGLLMLIKANCIKGTNYLQFNSK
jgi:DNA-binding transcriptional ArsR family regulator